VSDRAGLRADEREASGKASEEPKSSSAVLQHGSSEGFSGAKCRSRRDKKGSVADGRFQRGALYNGENKRGGGWGPAGLKRSLRFATDPFL
jgi:hypothetical protein